MNDDFVNELEARSNVWADEYLKELTVGARWTDPLALVLVRGAFKAGVRKAVMHALQNRKDSK